VNLDPWGSATASWREKCERIAAEVLRRVRILAQNDPTVVPPPDALSNVLASRMLAVQPPLPAPTPDNLSVVMAARVFLRGAVGNGNAAQPLQFGTHLTGGSYDGSVPVTLGTDATPLNTTSTIVARGTAKEIAVGAITASGDVAVNTGAQTMVRVVASANPVQHLENTGAGADAKKWQNLIVGNVLVFRLINDAESATANWLEVTRVGNVVSSIVFLGPVTASSFTGAFSGNASTATALQTPRAINGVNFDGTAPITVTAAATTLTGATLNASVTGSSLTTVGTLSALQLGAGATPDLASTGGNKVAGTATLVAGTVTVATSAISASHILIFNRATTGGAAGHLSYTRINGTSFTINSSSGTDTSTIDWILIKTH
jgi:hypothetical protein